MRNPALVSILGYATKQEILALEAGPVNFDPAEPPVLGRAADDRGGVRAREISLRKKDGKCGRVSGIVARSLG